MSGTGDDIGEWLTIAEAAERLGVKPIAIRGRIRRGTIRVRPAERENDGRTRVWIDARAVAGDGSSDVAGTGARDGGSDGTINALQDHIATLREQAERDRAERDRLVIELAEQRRREIELTERIDGLHRERLADAERLQRIMDRLAAPWWRRWFGS